MDLYADDTTLYMNHIGLDQDMLESNLQHALNLLKYKVSSECYDYKYRQN